MSLVLTECPVFINCAKTKLSKYLLIIFSFPPLCTPINISAIICCLTFSLTLSLFIPFFYLPIHISMIGSHNCHHLTKSCPCLFPTFSISTYLVIHLLLWSPIILSIEVFSWWITLISISINRNTHTLFLFFLFFFYYLWKRNRSPYLYMTHLLFLSTIHLFFFILPTHPTWPDLPILFTFLSFCSPLCTNNMLPTYPHPNNLLR